MSYERFSQWEDGQEDDQVEEPKVESFGAPLDVDIPAAKEEAPDSSVESICESVRQVSEDGGGSVGCVVSDWNAVRSVLEAEGYRVSYRDNKIHV